MEVFEFASCENVPKVYEQELLFRYEVIQFSINFFCLMDCGFNHHYANDLSGGNEQTSIIDDVMRNHQQSN